MFLLDEHQVVKPGEMGTIDAISTYARGLDLGVDLISLHDQFRCGGSEAYEQWVIDLLGPEGGDATGVRPAAPCRPSRRHRPPPPRGVDQLRTATYDCRV